MSLTTDEILKNWHILGALWLMEDQFLFANNELSFVRAIRKSRDKEFIEDMFRAAMQHWQLKVPLARHPLMSPEQLDVLSQDGHPEVLHALNNNPKLPPEAEARAFPSLRWKEKVARAETTTNPLILEWIAEKEISNDVRCAAARNNNANAKVLSKLALDTGGISYTEWDQAKTRAAVGGNLNTPVEVLIDLSYDRDRSVRAAVAGNPNTPVKILAELSGFQTEEVLIACAGNPSTSKERICYLASSFSSSYDVKIAAIKNTSIPVEKLQEIAEGKYHTDIIKLAKERLAKIKRE